MPRPSYTYLNEEEKKLPLKERNNLYNKRWRKKNQEKAKEIKNRYKVKNPEKYYQSQLKYYKTNKILLNKKNKEYRDKNKERLALYKRNDRPRINARRKQITRDWYKELKAGLTCLTCLESHPACLQFHHRDPSQKKFSISVELRRVNNRDMILEEVKKCDVLCANCHAKLHYNQKQIKVRA